MPRALQKHRIMKRKIWIKKASSFREAEELDNLYYRKMSFKERLEDIQLCRQMYFSLKRINLDEIRKRLRRVFRVIQQA